MFVGGSEILNTFVHRCRGSEIQHPFVCHCEGIEKFRIFLGVIAGDQKFWTFSCALNWLPPRSYGIKFWTLCCVLWGIRLSEFSSAFLGGSEIPNPSLCYLRDQKFLISCVFWSIRNSESSVVFFGFQKFYIFSCVVWGIRNLESSFVCYGGTSRHNKFQKLFGFLCMA